MQVFAILILLLTSVFARPSEDHVKTGKIWLKYQVFNYPFLREQTFFNALDLQKVQLIIDTDASFAVDDVVAICLAHSLANKGIWNMKDQFIIKKS